MAIFIGLAEDMIAFNIQRCLCVPLAHISISSDYQFLIPYLALCVRGSYSAHSPDQLRIIGEQSIGVDSDERSCHGCQQLFCAFESLSTIPLTVIFTELPASQMQCILCCALDKEPA